MSYVFRGSLRGALCGDCSEVPAGSTLRLYRYRPEQNETAPAVADTRGVLTLLTDDQVHSKASMLIAETTVDPDGNFLFRFGRAQGYKGEAFEIDLYCATVPHRKPSHIPPKPRQVSIAILQPAWEMIREGDYLAVWKYEIPSRFWSYFRGLFDAWLICGHLKTQREQAPISGATISAFDVNWLQDEALGSAVTDGRGHFRIDYLSEDFKLTPFSPWIKVERVSGPDVYFKATLGGTLILDEDRSVGRVAGRHNIGPCSCMELRADKVQAPAENKPHSKGAWPFDIDPVANGSGARVQFPPLALQKVR